MTSRRSRRGQLRALAIRYLETTEELLEGQARLSLLLDRARRYSVGQQREVDAANASIGVPRFGVDWTATASAKESADAE